MRSLTVPIAGRPLQLWPQRAAFLPDDGLLLVADAHLGKAQAFRRLGVPVPDGGTAQDLQRLDELIAATGARGLCFLGDLLHARHGRSAATLHAVQAWRARHASLTMTLVRGNHDRRAGDPPADWAIDIVDEPLRLGPLALCHHPDPRQGAYVLAGHVHPAVVVGRGFERLRLPCFHFGAQVGLLPAFGDFTGSHVLRPAEGEQVYVVAHDEVRPLG